MVNPYDLTRAIGRVEERIRARRATRSEWDAYRRLLRLRYGPPAHSRTHRSRQTEEALRTLRYATTIAVIREGFRAGIVGVRVVSDAMRRMVDAAQEFADVLAKAQAQIPPTTRVDSPP